MKILFVSNLFPDRTDPVRGRINATLLRHLTKKAEVRVVGLRPSLPFIGRDSDHLKPCPEDEILHPVYRTVIYIPKIGSRVNHRLLAQRAAVTLHRVQKDFDYDIILCSWLYPDVCGVARLLKDLKVPLVGISQGTDAHQYLENKFRRKLIVRTLNRIAGAITRSKDLAKRLSDAGVKEAKLHPIYNGVDTDTFRAANQAVVRQELNLPADRKIILYVGNFLPIKNPLLLARAHAELVAQQEDSPPLLVMIGAGELHEEIAATGAKPHVRLVGQKTSSEVAKHMQAADLLCIPSDNEGAPNVAFEAMACGLPIVATRVGGVPEVVGQDFLGALVARGAQAEFVSAIDDHLRSPRDRSRIAEHARQFSWSQTTDAYLRVLNTALR